MGELPRSTVTADPGAVHRPPRADVNPAGVGGVQRLVVGTGPGAYRPWTVPPVGHMRRAGRAAYSSGAFTPVRVRAWTTASTTASTSGTHGEAEPGSGARSQWISPCAVRDGGSAM